MRAVSKSFEFSASHTLFRSDWSQEENIRVFGKCSNPHGHGHNYKLEVVVKGELNPDTSMIIDARQLGQLVDEVIIKDLDHKNLNVDVSWLSNRLPTIEVIIDVIWDRLTEKIRQEAHQVELYQVTLWETSRIYALRRAD